MPYKDFGRMDVGDRVRIRATFRDPDDPRIFVDPDTVQCFIMVAPDGAPENPPVTRKDPGVYEAFFVPVEAGDHYVEMRGTGNWRDTVKGHFYAEASVFPV